MSKRQIIKIDEDKCNGCGLCIPNCPEGALQIIDGKVRLISDLFCDGLGACIGHCPEGAIEIEEREAQPYDENKVMGNIVKQGKNVIKAHLEHLKDHGEKDLLEQAVNYLKKNNIENPLKEEMSEKKAAPAKGCGCMGSQAVDLSCEKKAPSSCCEKASSQLRQWPVQLHLLNPQAPYLKNSDILIAADCVPFAYPNFHSDLLSGKIVIIFCPKLDDGIDTYIEKLTEIIKSNNIKSITIAHMEVPCCFGTVKIVKDAISASGINVPLKQIIVTIKGEIK